MKTSFFGNHHHVDVSQHLTGSGSLNTLSFSPIYSPNTQRSKIDQKRRAEPNMKMTSKGASQAGTVGQSITAARTTRSVLRQATNSPCSGGIASPGDKIKKKMTASEMSRTVLVDAKCLGPEEKITPSSLYKIFAKILKKYGESVHSEAKVVLYAFETLL